MGAAFRQPCVAWFVCRFHLRKSWRFYKSILIFNDPSTHSRDRTTVETLRFWWWTGSEENWQILWNRPEGLVIGNHAELYTLIILKNDHNKWRLFCAVIEPQKIFVQIIEKTFVFCQEERAFPRGKRAVAQPCNRDCENCWIETENCCLIHSVHYIMPPVAFFRFHSWKIKSHGKKIHVERVHFWIKRTFYCTDVLKNLEKRWANYI